MLIAERVGPYSVYGHVLELLRDAFRSNFPDGLMLRLDPVQDLSALGFALEDLTTRALEFRSVLKDEDISKNQGGGTPTNPLTRGSKRALRRITKFTRTGGLGSFRNFKGRDITDLAAEFGYTADTASTEVVATVITPSGKPRTLSINDGKSSAVSFPIERNSSVNSPSQLEFIATLEEVISGTGDALGIPGLKVDALPDFKDVEDYANIEKQWVINDEGSTL
ncbi:hypothetical protein [Corynebacterium callunae]|uniref:hypothetical protein n=1 Tax=Corynebacterium callunae TaxID=1721 RepID=UPI001FFF083A|nr:hypothetical protein [Corynebacterium callunae]MCK2200164.1 hypothetical protein [Corynebacterium callunae]